MPRNSWPVQDAKARFSELLDACVSDGPQLVTRRGAETAVLVAVDEWRRLEAVTHRSLKSLLLAAQPRAELAIPPRGRAHRRRPGAV